MKTTSKTTFKTFEVLLPVFKKGDDFSFCLEDTKGDPAKAFVLLAEQYETAAQACRSVANAIVEAKDPSDIEVYGDTHMISITAPEKDMKRLVEEGIVDSEIFDDMEDEEFDEDEEETN